MGYAKFSMLSEATLTSLKRRYLIRHRKLISVTEEIHQYRVSKWLQYSINKCLQKCGTGKQVIFPDNMTPVRSGFQIMTTMNMINEIL